MVPAPNPVSLSFAFNGILVDMSFLQGSGIGAIFAVVLLDGFK